MIRFVTQYTYLSNQTYAGGFDVGMVQAGFKLLHKTEQKGAFGTANCLANRHILGQDWTHQAGPASTWEVMPADVMVANPPCSGFSVMSAKHFRGANSPVMSCMWDYADYIAKVQPQIAVFESVQQAFSHKDGLTTMRALRAHVEEKTGKKWGLYHVRHNAYSVGGCAQRRRYFWVISQIPFGIEIPRPRILPKFSEVIGDLAPLGITWYPQTYRMPAHPWTQQLLSPDGTVDGHMYMDNPLTRRLSDIMAGVHWPAGKAMAEVVKMYYDKHGKLPKSWEATENKIVTKDFVMGFTTPVRWRGDNPARVITGGSLQMVIHPWLNRMITHREAARILGFPDNWNIQPLRRVSGIHMTWGKGISTHCGKWIGEWIQRALDGNPGQYTGDAMSEREWDIDVTDAWRTAAPQHTIDYAGVVQ